jgi:hypothetical protein
LFKQKSMLQGNIKSMIEKIILLNKASFPYIIYIYIYIYLSFYVLWLRLIFGSNNIQTVTLFKSLNDRTIFKRE